MKCDFSILEAKTIEETIKFLHSIGISWLKADDFLAPHSPIINIELFDTPDVLRIYSIESMPSVCSLSALGVSFYLCVAPPNTALSTEKGNLDGVVFCPMTNVKAINAFGELRLHKNGEAHESV